MQFLRIYQVHKWAWPWTRSKVRNGDTKVNVKLFRDFGVEKIPLKLQHDACNAWRVIAFTRPFDFGLDWKFKKVVQWSTSNFDEILMWRILLSVKLHDAGKFRVVVMFTRRCCQLLPFDHDLDWNVKNVKQWSTLNSSKILIWRICPCKVTWYGNSWGVIMFKRQLDLELVWKF